LGRGELSNLLLFISYTNFVDGGPQAWFERLLKEGVLCWWDGSVLMEELNLEGHSIKSENFCFIMCKMNIDVHTPDNENELNGVHAKHV